MADTEIAAYNMESDISKLEAPTFTTIERNQPAAMLSLNWDHQVNLVGKKVLNPMIHCCDKCLKPILIYGRMIPCKHVFCLGCARQDEKQCPRCNDKVNRVEQAGLGSIFLCTQGGSRYGNTGCRRTYLSSRDLHAHVAHRHMKGKEEEKIIEKKDVNSTEAIRNAVNSLNKASLAAAVAAANSVTSYPSTNMNAPVSTPSSSNLGSSSYSSAGSTPQSTTVSYNAAAQAQFRAGANAPPSTNHISVINTRQSNLITVPIQGSGGADSTPPAVHPGYVPGSYPAYTAYPGQPAAGQPASTTYTQGAPQTYSQPPPTYAYPGNYASAPPPGAAGQYSTGPPPSGAPYSGGGGPVPAPGAPYSGAGGPGPTSGYVPAPTGYTGSGGPPYQGQWTRPPPGGGRPPSGTNHQNYYRR